MIGVMDLRSKLGWALINKIYLNGNTNSQRSNRKARDINDHNLTNAPPYTKKFISGKWKKVQNVTTKNMYVEVSLS